MNDKRNVLAGLVMACLSTGGPVLSFPGSMFERCTACVWSVGRDRLSTGCDATGAH